MNLTDTQIRGRIKNLAKENNADPRVLIRIFKNVIGSLRALMETAV